MIKHDETWRDCDIFQHNATDNDIISIAGEVLEVSLVFQCSRTTLEKGELLPKVLRCLLKMTNAAKTLSQIRYPGSISLHRRNEVGTRTSHITTNNLSDEHLANAAPWEPSAGH